jgi:hypothetical protein
MRNTTSKRAARAKPTSSGTEGSAGNVRVCGGWREAYPIIASARRSIVIVDSFLAGEVLDVADVVEQAAAQPHVNKLTVSLYMASPDKPFGAQRIREKEAPEMPRAKKGRQTEKNETLKRFSKALSAGISEADLHLHIDRFEKCVYEVFSHIAREPKVHVDVFTYPVMTTARFFVIDDKDLIVGWFPLMGSNPGYPCCHLRDDRNDIVHRKLLDKFRAQVKILQGISTKLSNAKISKIIKTREPNSVNRSPIDRSAVLYT